MTDREATDLVTSLFEGWYAVVVRYAARRTGSVEASEDIVQDAFFQLFVTLKSGKWIENPRAWTFLVVRRQSQQFLGRLRQQVEEYDPIEILDTIPAGWTSPVELEKDPDRLQSLLVALTPREEEVLHLRLAAMKYHEIAAALDISMSSVNTLLARALKKLKLKVAGTPSKTTRIQNAKQYFSKSLH